MILCFYWSCFRQPASEGRPTGKKNFLTRPEHLFNRLEQTLSIKLCDAASDIKAIRKPEKKEKMSDNRQNIIDATSLLLQTHGLTRLTTREIAHKANVAEGLIYHHFKDKAELIFSVVETRVSETRYLLQNLPLAVGTRTLLEILEDVLQAVYWAHYEIVLIICSIFADHQLRVRMREIIKERNMGPQHTIEGLSVFLAAEQRLGRLSNDVDPSVVAKCLWMISIQSAMNDQLMGRIPEAGQIHREIRDYVQTLMTGLAPQPEITEKNERAKNKVRGSNEKG